MKPVLFASAALSLFATPALADGIVDNVNGLTITEGGKIVRFKAILVDKDGRVTRLVPPGEEPPPTTIELGSSSHAVTRSSMVSNGESAGTSTPSWSSMSWARGVASLSL